MRLRTVNGPIIFPKTDIRHWLSVLSGSWEIRSFFRFLIVKKSHKMIQTEIQRNSIYKENLIIINSVQFNPTDFRKKVLW